MDIAWGQISSELLILNFNFRIFVAISVDLDLGPGQSQTLQEMAVFIGVESCLA